MTRRVRISVSLQRERTAVLLLRRTPRRYRAARVCLPNPCCSLNSDPLNNIGGHLLTFCRSLSSEYLFPPVTACTFDGQQPQRPHESTNHSPAADVPLVT
ncbi:hypothetical protein Y032_0027g1619 [Ancylostoma ceylanicum]|uniref:Uncharacterized protein n=1 Tax=Ancylostoma ceylanicum TaxID=53326 RepID=A0A016UVZ8_9BILA|nr:hypothetical protein Y032_0027g1619 [Ancylostoma ceylanicum]